MGRELPLWADICVERATDEIARRRPYFSRTSDPQPGDIVHVKSFGGAEHVGVIVAPGVMLQATQKHGVHRMRLDHPWCSSRILGFYRFNHGIRYARQQSCHHRKPL